MKLLPLVTLMIAIPSCQASAASETFPSVPVVVMSNYASSQVLQSLSEQDQRRVFMLASFWTVYGHGSNNNGFSDDTIAAFLDVTVNNWQRTKKLMRAKGLITTDNLPTSLYRLFVPLM